MTEKFLQKRFRRSDKIVGRTVGGEYVLVPILETASEVDCIFNLNEVATRIWDLLDGTNNVEGIQRIIASEYEVSVDVLTADLKIIFEQFERIGVVVEV